MITYMFNVDNNNNLNCYLINKTIKKYTGKDAVRKLNHTKGLELMSAKTKVRNISSDKSVHNVEFYGKDFRVIFQNAYRFTNNKDISIDKEINDLLDVVKYNNTKKKIEKENKKKKKMHFFQKVKSLACAACLAALIITTNETRKTVNELKAQNVITTYEDTGSTIKKGSISSLFKKEIENDVIIINDNKQYDMVKSEKIISDNNIKTNNKDNSLKQEQLILKTLVKDNVVADVEVKEEIISTEEYFSSNEYDIVNEQNNDYQNNFYTDDALITDNSIPQIDFQTPDISLDTVPDINYDYLYDTVNQVPTVDYSNYMSVDANQVPTIDYVDNNTILNEQTLIDPNMNVNITNNYAPYWTGKVLNSYDGVVDCGPSGGKESFYDADSFNPVGMANVVQTMRDLGYDEINYPYYIREDGVRMLGNYVMVAANLEVHPRGSIVETTLGQGIVCDTGSFAKSNVRQLDIATNWTRHRW